MRILIITFLQVYVTHYFYKINKISFQHGFVGTTRIDNLWDAWQLNFYYNIVKLL